MEVYSHSKISTFEQCRYKFKLQYIDKVKVEIPSTIEAFMGGVVHEVLEKLYFDLRFINKINTLKELLEYYNILWNQNYSDDILIVKQQFSPEYYKKIGEKYVVNYYLRNKPFNQMKIIDIETQELLELPNGKFYNIRIDKLGFKEGIYYICDYKTSRWMKSKKEIDQDRQLSMYSLWVKNKFEDAKEVFLVWHMLAFNQDIVSKRSEGELKKELNTVILKIEEIENCKTFPKNLSKLCEYCLYNRFCSLM